jgi:tellurite resistance protein
MDLKDFTDTQRKALLDLAVIGMYSDGHLAAAEQERVSSLLTAMGLVSEYEHTRLFDDAVSRISRYVSNPERSSAQVRALAQSFSTPEQRRSVHDMLRDVVSSDGGVSPQESQFLSLLRESLQL